MRHEARQVPSWLIFDVRQKMRALAAIGLAVLLVGCASHMLYEPWAHTDHLLKMFPPGRTSADEVLFRWRPHIPDISLDRAEIDSHWDSKLRARFAAAEKKIGLAVARCDRFYLSSDVQCWFYYDERGMVVHAETEVRSSSKKTPNKAPEPTPGAVTPRASERDST